MFSSAQAPPILRRCNHLLKHIATAQALDIYVSHIILYSAEFRASAMAAIDVINQLFFFLTKNIASCVRRQQESFVRGRFCPGSEQEKATS